MKRRQRSPREIWFRRIGLPLFSIGALLLAAELGFRLTGYKRPIIQPQYQQRLMTACADALNARFVTDGFTPDNYLLWTMKPGTNLGGLTVDENGLLGSREPKDPFARTQVRVLCLGDSMSALTYRTWPGRVERLARMAPGGPTIDVFNASLPGYSTEQGLRRLQQLTSLRPDVVIACFGWNDQFPALSVPDRELGYANFATRWAHRLFGSFRLYQFFTASAEVRSFGRINGSTAEAEEGTRELRVSPEQFEQNLLSFIRETRSMQAIPVLATQPENLGEATERHLQLNQFSPGPGEDPIRLHRRYNDIVRNVATSQQVPLVDLEEEFLRRRREHFFEADGIHLTSRGHNHIARLILALLREEGKLTPQQYDAIAASEKHDTTAPDKPRVAWSVVPPHVHVPTTGTVRFSVLPRNAGNTRWLKQHVIPRLGNRTNVSYGGVVVAARWRTVNSPTTGTVAEARLPQDILPGETTSVTLTAAAPPVAGNYELEIGLRAEGIGELTQYGAETTTLTVTAQSQ